MVHALGLLLLAGTLCGFPQVGAADAPSPPLDAKGWLTAMIDAAKTLDYRGEFVYVQGLSVEAMGIVHGVIDGREMQRVVALNGPRRELIVDGDVVVVQTDHPQLSPQGDRLRRSPFPVALPQELDQLEVHYRFELLGEGRTANRPTQRIAIHPRDKYRFGYQLWLDQQTKMVLRAALFDDRHEVIEQLMFTRFVVDPPLDPQTFAPTATGSPPPPPPAAPASLWSLSALPPGFDPVLHNRYGGNHGPEIEHIVLSDGLATASVFLEHLDGAAPLLKGPSRLGAMNAYGRVIDDHQVMVVGEVPAVTVQDIAQAVERGTDVTVR